MAGSIPDPDPRPLRWRELSDHERERQYSPSSCLPDGDYRPFVAEYRRASDSAWSALASRTDVHLTTVPYGTAASQTVDVAIPTGDASPPLVVFFHGGYWQELSKLDSRFAAADAIGRGWAFAAVDYTLAPAATLPEIVDECRMALRTLFQDASSLGFDATRLVVAGSSAGAHLAAMVAATANPPVHGAVLVSGVFDLEPLIRTSVNAALSLDLPAARATSPLHLDLDGFPPALIAYGDNETDEFKAQSHAFAGRLRVAGGTASILEIADRNHFDVIVDLATPRTVLGDAVAELMERHADV